MSRIQKPVVNTKCVADNYASASEKIVELTFPDGTGCLICLFAGENENRIDVYNIDKGIRVVIGESNK